MGLEAPAYGAWLAHASIANVGGTVKWYFVYRKGGVNVNLTDTIGPSLDTWYSIEVYVRVSATVGEVRLYINGDLRLSDSGFDNSDAGSVGAFRVGERGSNGQTAHDTYVDCVVAADAYIGPEAGGQQLFTLINELNY